MTKFSATWGRPSWAGGSRRSRWSEPSSSAPVGPSRVSSGTGRQERIDERARLHRDQIAGLLTHPEELHRQLQLVHDREDRAALGGAVELGDHDPGDLGRLGELAGLHDRVLARGPIQPPEGAVAPGRGRGAGASGPAGGPFGPGAAFRSATTPRTWSMPESTSEPEMSDRSRASSSSASHSGVTGRSAVRPNNRARNPPRVFA